MISIVKILIQIINMKKKFGQGKRFSATQNFLKMPMLKKVNLIIKRERERDKQIKKLLLIRKKVLC